MAEEAQHQNIDQLLINWKLGHLVENFKRHGVDLEALILLDQENIITLCPTLGDQLKFANKLKILKSQKKIPQNKENTGPSATLPEDDHLNESFDWGASYFHVKESQTLQEELPVAKRQRIIKLSLGLADILDEDIVCQGIVNLYSKTAHLSDHHRSTLSTHIVKKLFKEFGNKITADIYSAASLEIVSLFPTEKQFTWYSPPSRGIDKCEASGTLYYKVKHMRSELQHMGVLSPIKRNAAVNSSIESTEIVNVDSFSASVQLVKQSELPAEEELIFAWGETRDYRFADWSSSGNSITAIFENFPALKTQFIFSLLEEDCKALGFQSENLETKWDAFFEQLVKHLESASKVKKTLKNAAKRLNDSSCREAKIAIASSFIGIKWPYSQASKKSRRLKAAEICLQFIDTAESEETAIAKWKSISSEINGAEPRPLVICIGEEFEDHTSVVLVVAGHCIKTISIFEAVHLALQIQAVFKSTPFSDNTAYIWSALDTAIFQTSAIKRKYSVSHKILSDLGL